MLRHRGSQSTARGRQLDSPPSVGVSSGSMPRSCVIELLCKVKKDKGLFDFGIFNYSVKFNISLSNFFSSMWCSVSKLVSLGQLQPRRSTNGPHI